MVAQVGLCLALLVGSSLLLRSLWFVEAIDPGFTTARLYSTSPGLPDRTTPALDRSASEQLVARLADLPEIESVSTVYKVPLSGVSPQADLTRPALRVAYNYVGPRYFRTIGLPLVQGRDFTDVESSTNAPVAIVSEGAAARLWPGVDAIGKTVQLAEGKMPLQVVGVVRDARVGLLWRPEDAYLYLPIGSRPAYAIFRAPSWSLAEAESRLQRAAADVHPGLRAPVRALEESFTQTYAPFRLLAAGAGLLATLTLLLASVGLYGVVSLMTSQRTHEMAIRVALGATSADVMRLVFGSSLRPFAVGIVVGVSGALVFARLLASALIGVSPFDLAAFVAPTAFMALVAALATAVPARRAAVVDPMVTFRT